jgi:hypothetical protein
MPLNEDDLVANLQCLSIDVSLSLKGVQGARLLGLCWQSQRSDPRKVRKSNKSSANKNANHVFKSSDVMHHTKFH